MAFVTSAYKLLKIHKSVSIHKQMSLGDAIYQNIALTLIVSGFFFYINHIVSTKLPAVQIIRRIQE